MSAASPTTITPPIAKREESNVIFTGVEHSSTTSKNETPLLRQSESSTEKLLDPAVPIPNPYGWLRDDTRSSTEILDHLKLENEYTESCMKETKGLQEKLYEEMISSIQETDYTVPTKKDDWYYYKRTFEGKSYDVHCRAPVKEDVFGKWDGKAESPVLEGEEVILDVNELGKDKSYCSVGRVAASPSHLLLAYAVDFTGNEKCSLYVKDLKSGEIVDEDEALEVYGVVIWGKDDSTLFYITMDHTKRPYRLHRRSLNSEGQEDELLFEESDELFTIFAYKSSDGRYLFLEASSKETSEFHYLDLDDPDAKLQCVAKRRSKVLYDVEHQDGKWLISTNEGGTPNMKLMISPSVPNSESHWKLLTMNDGEKALFDGGYDRSLSDVKPFKNHLVASGREGGIPRIWVITLTDNDSQATTADTMEMLQFEETFHDVGLGPNREYDTDTLLVSYDSLVTPLQSLQISMSNPTSSSHRHIIKEKKVPGYQKDLYDCTRIDVLSRDGKTHIPVSLVYRKDVMQRHLDTKTPVHHLHLYGYGSYGSSIEASFAATRLTFLNRGVVYAIAHVRGGGEMGRQWYEEPNGAKYLCKKNTFYDFVDVAKYLVSGDGEMGGLVKEGGVSCEGRSAGGLLIAASLNLEPQLFRTALLGVPFVDIVCTMSDASIPLTTEEWEEWGNPNEEKYHKYMLEYSPMDNVRTDGSIYPAALLTGGLHDPRVPYWEPAKLTAVLRDAKEKGHIQGFRGPVCLKIDLSAGHFSASDRYKYYRERSFEFAFILNQMGSEELLDSKE